MNKTNDRILSHRVLRKLIEMNLVSQGEIRRLVMEEMVKEAQTKDLKSALAGLRRDKKNPENFMKKYVKDGETVYPYAKLGELPEEEQKKYKAAVDGYVTAFKAQATPTPKIKQAGEKKEQEVDKAVDQEIETSTDVDDAPTEAKIWDPTNEDAAALIKAFKNYTKNFYYSFNDGAPRTKQTLQKQSNLVKELRKALRIVLYKEAEEAKDQEPGFEEPVSGALQEEEEEPKRLNINNFKASLNMLQIILGKLDDSLNVWITSAKKGRAVQRENKKRLIKIIERVQGFAKRIYDFGMNIIKVPEVTINEYVELSPETIIDATKEVQAVHEKVKTAFLITIEPASTKHNRSYEEIRKVCIGVDKALSSITKYFSQLTKFSEKSADDASFDKILEKYREAFKNLNVPFAIVKTLDNEFVVGVSDPGVIEQTMIEVKDFSVELQRIFGVDGIPETSPEPSRPESEEAPEEELPSPIEIKTMDQMKRYISRKIFLVPPVKNLIENYSDEDKAQLSKLIMYILKINSDEDTVRENQQINRLGNVLGDKEEAIKIFRLMGEKDKELRSWVINFFNAKRSTESKKVMTAIIETEGFDSIDVKGVQWNLIFKKEEDERPTLEPVQEQFVKTIKPLILTQLRKING